MSPPGPGERSPGRDPEVYPRCDDAGTGRALVRHSRSLPGRISGGDLGMISQVRIQSQGRQPLVVSFSTSNLQWLEEMRNEYNRRFENDLTLVFILDGAIINEIWRLCREIRMSEERTFSIGIEGEL